MPRRLLQLALMLAIIAAAARANGQAGNTVIIRFAGAPSGSCSPIAVAVNNATGDFYDCLSATWHAVSSASGGSVTAVLGTANQIVSDGSTTTPTLSIATTFTFPGTVTNNLSIFGATTSAQLAGILSDETGSGLAVFATSPVFTTPNIGSATGSVSGNAGTATALAANPTDCADANSYATTIAASGNLTCSTWAMQEVPSGTINSSNVTFTLAHTPVSGSQVCYQNGIRTTSGGVDYTIATATMTWGVAPTTGDTLVCDYRF